MTRIRGISNEITRALQQYSSEVEKSLEKSKEKVAKEAVKTLKSTSPSETGSYKKGWRVKQVGTAKVIHNATDYQLTHLLEHGHAKKNGGRVAPIVHIKPVEEKAIEDFERAIREEIE